MLEVARVVEAVGVETSRDDEWVLAPVCFCSFCYCSSGVWFVEFISVVAFQMFLEISAPALRLAGWMSAGLKKEKCNCLQSFQRDVTFGLVVIESEEHVHFVSGAVRGLIVMLSCDLNSREIHASGKADYDNLSITTIMN